MTNVMLKTKQYIITRFNEPKDINVLKVMSDYIQRFRPAVRSAVVSLIAVALYLIG
jgi:hypothetical protein